MSAFAVRYKTVDLGDVQIFYREAGARTAPSVLLLHGFPTSSHMYRDLIPRLLAFVDALELERFAMMVFDYGAPVGFRLAAAHPRRIAAIITQNGNAYEEGLREDTLGPMRAYWKRPTANQPAKATPSGSGVRRHEGTASSFRG
jgi:pimeloyl-ACP methyl ester carboxylesterase